MKKEVMEKWVEALRSGTYRQGRNYLKNGNSYCCLGVLCEISGLAYCDDRYYPNGDVQEWAGLKQRNPFIGNIPITGYNDGYTDGNGLDRKYSFTEIADLIEKNWEKL